MAPVRIVSVVVYHVTTSRGNYSSCLPLKQFIKRQKCDGWKTLNFLQSQKFIFLLFSRYNCYNVRHFVVEFLPQIIAPLDTRIIHCVSNSQRKALQNYFNIGLNY